MWYIFGTGWKRFGVGSEPDRTYKIGHATSLDGITWTKEEGRRIISDRLGELESQALPTVVSRGGRHHMFFCYRHSSDFRQNKARGYRLGHAYSDDLHEWIRDDESVPGGTSGEWDSDMQCYPHAFAFRGRTYLLYNGNEFGRGGFGLAILEEGANPLPPLIAGRAESVQISEHLKRCDHSFVPPLSTRVDIAAYAAKIAAKASCLEAWDHGRLIGLAAYYVDASRQVAFLSNLSIDPTWQRRGLAGALLAEAIRHTCDLGLVDFELEVDVDNHAAMALYKCYGFRVRSIASGVATMHLPLRTATP
jgi:ribosomal protein S18 acetylase RimI-like enzyme